MVKQAKIAMVLMFLSLTVLFILTILLALRII
jgi:hypothetical protein